MSNQIHYDYIFKICVIGDPSVGKSSLVLRFSDDEFQGNYKTTIGVDFKIKTIELGGKVIKLQIWDTAGTEQFRTICSHYYRNSHGVILVYDCTKLTTFNNVKNVWLNEIKEKAPEDANKLIIGNKCDLINEKTVQLQTAKTFADSLKIPIIETSAKDSTNVTLAFVEMAAAILARVGSKPMKLGDQSSIKIGVGESVEPGYYYGCC